MPLVVDQLQLWTIGYKWAGLDSNRLWLRIPTPVRDNFSTLLEAILQGHMDCLTLALEKYHGDDPEIAKCHIRYWTEDVYAGVFGRSYNRKLLKHAVIDRWAFQDWCERRSITLPEFWFPPGWTEYRWPEDDPAGRDALVPASMNPEGSEPGEPPSNIADVEEDVKKSRNLTRFRIASQVIAEAIWKKNPETTIAAMVQHDLIQNYGGAGPYGDEAVRRWVKEVAPPEVSAKRGRPKKKNSTEDE